MGIREAILQEFMERGLEEGRVEGRVENTRFVISRARKKGMPVEEMLPSQSSEAARGWAAGIALQLTVTSAGAGSSIVGGPSSDRVMT